jgi:cadmium resistance protein CadD (predicted permease)
VHTIAGVVVLASLAYVGTMVDNYFAFSAQLIVTEPARYRRVSWSQAVAVLILVVLAASVGEVLSAVPLRWIGLLCVAPFAFALHAWRHRRSPHEQFRRGAITTFLVTLAIGGDNVAVWIPLFRSSGLRHLFVAVAVFVVWELIFLTSARRLATHPRVVTWGRARMPALMPFVYVLLGVLILIECHSI